MKTPCCTLILAFLFYLNSVESSSSDDSSESSRSRLRSRSRPRSSSPSSSLQQNRTPLNQTQIQLIRDVLNENEDRGYPNLFPTEEDVYPPIPLPNPPYRVVLMGKEWLRGVQILYSTRTMRGNNVSIESHTYYPVRHALYVVKKGRRIIGYTQPDREFMPLGRRPPHGGIEYVAINLQTSGPRLELLDNRECNALGLFRKLPSNTVFENQIQNYPDITIIKVGYQVAGAFTDGVFRHED